MNTLESLIVDINKDKEKREALINDSYSLVKLFDVKEVEWAKINSSRNFYEDIDQGETVDIWDGEEYGSEDAVLKTHSVLITKNKVATNTFTEDFDKENPIFILNTLGKRMTKGINKSIISILETSSVLIQNTDFDVDLLVEANRQMTLNNIDLDWRFIIVWPNTIWEISKNAAFTTTTSLNTDKNLDITKIKVGTILGFDVYQSNIITDNKVYFAHETSIVGLKGSEIKYKKAIVGTAAGKSTDKRNYSLSVPMAMEAFLSKLNEGDLEATPIFKSFKAEIIVA